MTGGEEGIKPAVALVTGGAHGIGAGIVRRLTSLGSRVVVADIDDEAGRRLADEVGGLFVHCNVSRFDDNQAAVSAAVETYGGLDVVALNAGVSFGAGEEFDPAAYRRAMAINVDGVMYGAQSALPALAAHGGGDIVVSASIAGLVPTPLEPVYATNKSAVVGLVRALGPAWAARGVRVNALCPGFADTAIIDRARELIASRGIQILTVETVTAGFIAILAAGRTGECWYVLPGLPIEPFRFAEIPRLLSVYPDPSTVRITNEADVTSDRRATGATLP